MSRHQSSIHRVAKQAASFDRQLAGSGATGKPGPTARSGNGFHDIGFRAIIVLVACIAIWLLMMPWASAIASASMRRFHLRTGSFIAWAAQFPIPAMYNFSNRAEVDIYPPGLVDPLIDETEKRHFNHFPVRCVTFADGRFRHFHEGQDRWITVDTSYRGQELETRFHAKAMPKGGFKLIRLPDAQVSR